MKSRLPIIRRSPGESSSCACPVSWAAISSSADDFTPRELQVLRRLALGHTNKEIGSELFIGEETVKTHIGRVLAKLQVENRAQAIVQALKRGLVTLEELQ